MQFSMRSGGTEVPAADSGTPQPTIDHEQFRTEWEGKIRLMAAGQRFAGPDLEDAVQQFFVDIWHWQYLERFDATQGTPFSAYIYKIARMRFADYRRSLWRQSQHEFVANVEQGTKDIQGTGPSSGSEFSFLGSDQIRFLYESGTAQPAMSTPDPHMEELISIIELNRALEAVHNELAQLPATKTKDFARLFRDMVEQVANDGDLNMAAIAEKYGYSRNAIRQQVADLRSIDILRRFRATLGTHGTHTHGHRNAS